VKLDEIYNSVKEMHAPVNSGDSRFGGVMFGIIVGCLCSFIMINYLVSKKIGKPFRQRSDLNKKEEQQELLADY